MKKCQRGGGETKLKLVYSKNELIKKAKKEIAIIRKKIKKKNELRKAKKNIIKQKNIQKKKEKYLNRSKILY